MPADNFLAHSPSYLKLTSKRIQERRAQILAHPLTRRDYILSSTLQVLADQLEIHKDTLRMDLYVFRRALEFIQEPEKRLDLFLKINDSRRNDDQSFIGIRAIIMDLNLGLRKWGSVEWVE